MFIYLEVHRLLCRLQGNYKNPISISSNYITDQYGIFVLENNHRHCCLQLFTSLLVDFRRNIENVFSFFSFFFLHGLLAGRSTYE